ncbi:MAG: CAP domain-containing protein [Solirubrobacteraceae bacterium]
MAPRRVVLLGMLAASFLAAGSANAWARAGRAAPTARHACANAALMPSATDIRAIRAATLCLVNRQRARHGERPLRANVRLRRAAQAHSRSMAFEDYFDHVGPRGQTPLARMRAVGYLSSRQLGFEVGENIAWGTLWLATPGAIVAAWMASPGHRANILDPRYRETGIGVSPHPLGSRAHGQRGAIYTQDFGVISR